MTQVSKLPHQQLRVPELDTPALVLDRGILERNLTEMAQLCAAAGIELMPHAKTHRIAQIGRMQVAAGAAGLTVAKLGEAEEFARAGIERLLVAYPIVGELKFARAAQLATRCDLTLSVDDAGVAEALGEYFAARDLTARVMLLVDSGLHRVGVEPQHAVALASRLAALPGIQLEGILTHEGTVYSSPDTAELERRSVEVARTMVSLADEIRASGVPLRTVSLGSSASARALTTVPGVTQIRPGMYAFNDLGQIALGVADFATTAIRMVATVVSNPRSGVACIDAGGKMLGADRITASAFADELPGFGYLADLPGWVIARLSEEHGWLRWEGDGEPSPLAIGQVVQVVPNHVCMTIYSSGEVVILDDGRETDRWQTFSRPTSA